MWCDSTIGYSELTHNSAFGIDVEQFIMFINTDDLDEYKKGRSDGNSKGLLALFNQTQ